jgi:hypothetical protein
MTRRIDRRELERRLREEAPRGSSLSEGWRSELGHRLDLRVRGGLSAATVAPRRVWLVAGLGVAAAVALGVLALWPGAAVAPEPQARPEVARALGQAVHASAAEQPRTLVLALERGEDPLVAEAQRLVTDARRLADQLAAPLRGVGRAAMP